MTGWSLQPRGCTIVRQQRGLHAMEAADLGLLDEAAPPRRGFRRVRPAWVSISASRSTRCGARRRISNAT